jgi:hypothetical protein
MDRCADPGHADHVLPADVLGRVDQVTYERWLALAAYGVVTVCAAVAVFGRPVWILMAAWYRYEAGG